MPSLKNLLPFLTVMLTTSYLWHAIPTVMGKGTTRIGSCYPRE